MERRMERIEERGNKGRITYALHQIICISGHYFDLDACIIDQRFLMICSMISDQNDEICEIRMNIISKKQPQ